MIRATKGRKEDGPMTEPMQDLGTVLKRLEKVEEQNRHLRYMGFCLLAIGAMTFLLGGSSSPKGTLEAQQFVVRDATGKIRGKLGTTEPGMSVLSLLDDSGSAVIELKVGPERAVSLIMKDNVSDGALKLGNKMGVPYVQLEARGSARVFLGAVPDPLLNLLSVDGKKRASLVVGTDGLPALHFYGNDEKKKLTVGMTNTFESFIDTGLNIFDQDGNSRASLELAGGMYPGLSLVDEDLLANVRVNVARGSPTFRLSDKDGKVIWSAP